MNDRANQQDHGQRAIALLLWTGTCLACAVLALGMLAGVLQGRGVVLPAWLAPNSLLLGGVVIFVLLPVARVIATLIMFARARDVVYMALSGFVLLVIGAGVLCELRLS